LAWVSLWLSLLGCALLFSGGIDMNLPALGLLISIAAIVYGCIARSRISKAGGSLTGGGKAIGAIIVSSTLVLLAIVASIAMPLLSR